MLPVILYNRLLQILYKLYTKATGTCENTTIVSTICKTAFVETIYFCEQEQF